MEGKSETEPRAGALVQPQGWTNAIAVPQESCRLQIGPPKENI
jgi:hypothetical protein